jgi:hypothetical protein
MIHFQCGCLTVGERSYDVRCIRPSILVSTSFNWFIPLNSQKMSLWANTKSKLSTHNVVLDDRHLSLVEVQESMVKESGAVLGQGGRD